MSPGDETEPVADHELLYRVASEKSEWYQPSSDRPYRWEAFNPNEKDLDGLSVPRAKYKSPERTIEDHPRAVSGKNYFLFVLQASRLRNLGVEVKATPLPHNRGHASLSNLNFSRKTTDKNWCRETAKQIVEQAIVEAIGPITKA